MQMDTRLLSGRLRAAVAAGVLMAACTAQARDIEDMSGMEMARFCEKLWTVAKSVAQQADAGEDEDEILGRLEQGLKGTIIGPKLRHLYRTTIKGAYLRDNESPSRYAARVQLSCMEATRGK